jgi:uncharacterized coiled-coil DUF342 family protein
MKFNFFNTDFSTQLSEALTMFTSAQQKLQSLNEKISVDKKAKVEQIASLQQEVKSYDQLMRKSNRVIGKIKDIIGDIDEMDESETTDDTSSQS